MFKILIRLKLNLRSLYVMKRLFLSVSQIGKLNGNRFVLKVSWFNFRCSLVICQLKFEYHPHLKPNLINRSISPYMLKRVEIC